MIENQDTKGELEDLKDPDNINDRLVYIIKELGHTPNSFGHKIGKDPTVIYNIVSGRRTKPSFEIIKLIILTFDSIDCVWLLTGKGWPFISDTKNAEGNMDMNMVAEARSPYGNKRDLEKEISILKSHLRDKEIQIETLYKAFERMGKG